RALSPACGADDRRTHTRGMDPAQGALLRQAVRGAQPPAPLSAGPGGCGGGACIDAPRCADVVHGPPRGGRPYAGIPGQGWSGACLQLGRGGGNLVALGRARIEAMSGMKERGPMDEVLVHFDVDSPRARYIARHLLEGILGLRMRTAASTEEFRSAQGPRLAYGRQVFVGALLVPESGGLARTRPPQGVVEGPDGPHIFPTAGGH